MTEELYVHQEINVDPGQEPMRIDHFLMDRLQGTSRNRLQKAIKSGQVKVNDQEVKPNYKVAPGDFVQVYYKEPPKLGQTAKAEEIPLDVIFEDDDVLVVNKPAGMVVHPGIGNTEGTLVNALVHYFFDSDLPIMEGNLADRPGIVHRIDKDTSGLLVIAKNEASMTHLAKQFSDRKIGRSYQALVWGEPDETEGTIDAPIGRHPRNRILYTVVEDAEEGKEAITHYKLLRGLYYVSLLECRLETGRTHQIRVHMKHIGHTIFNDYRYGGDRILKGTVFSKYRQFVNNCFELLPRQGLHAATLGFVHPKTGEKMEFSAPLPEDMQSVLDKWTAYVQTKRDHQ